MWKWFSAAWDRLPACHFLRRKIGFQSRGIGFQPVISFAGRRSRVFDRLKAYLAFP
jgi:hypothetical protein